MARLNQRATKRYVTAEQLPDFAIGLASSRAMAVSGQSLPVCGDTGVLS
ncbi:MAG: hypothetical protein KJZ83_00820 [Burkholderiaceae bacterium]|nr:hypothetical protein [Burkholderiaceae bacterium]